MTTGAAPSGTGKWRFEGREKHVNPRVLVYLVAITMATRISAAPAVAANLPAAPSETLPPPTGVGDVAPFSLESSGAGGDYTGPYISAQPLTPSASAHAPAPAQPLSFPSLPSP